MNIRFPSVALAIGLWAMHVSPLRAQCDGCVADLSCTADPAYPTLCPVQPPDAIAGEPYAADITFWLPDNFTDPGTGFNVDFLMMTITGVSGLPYGLDITYSEPSGVYYPQENPYGCSRICGTPVGAGTYTVTISILALVEYSGFELSVPQQFPLTLVVQPGTGGNSGFSFTPTNGCGSTDVQFDALIDGQGAPVTYDWDFGNGNTSDEASPSQNYGAPGTYTISLQTTIGGYVLNQVNVGGVNDNWCGDVEEPSLFGACTGDPDLYFILTDGNGNTVASSVIDNSTSADWSAVGQLLAAPPYSLAFFDEDLVSQDDELGTFNMPQGISGSVPFTLGNGTFGSLQIDLLPQQAFNDTDSVVVFAAPQPITDYDTLAASICVSDTGLVNITWFNDGDTVLTGSTACINADSSGTWWAVVTNGFGCATPSDTILICPQITIAQNGEVLYTVTGLDNYVWSLNSTIIAGEDGPFLIAETGGAYSVAATNMDGCALTAEYVLMITGNAQPDRESTSLEVFPNPNNGSFSVIMHRQMAQQGVLRIVDMTGRTVYSQSMLTTVGRTVVPIASGLAPGSYSILLVDAATSATERIVITR